MTLSHPALFALGFALCAVAARFLRRRKIPQSQPRKRRGDCYNWLILPGLILVAIAAGGPVIALHPSREIAAMVDLSPSTRGAAFRDRATLLYRIRDLAGSLPVRLLAFSDGLQDLPQAAALPDLPCEQTRFKFPSADAVLLFSDGRFTIPDVGPPTYPIIDPLLIDAPDAAVAEMHFDGNAARATVRDRGTPQKIIFTGTDKTNPIAVGNGSSVINGGNANGTLVQARLIPTDLWPENDSLTLPALMPVQLQFWWIGSGSPPAGWTAVRPADLPAEPNAYLAVGAIALANVPADDLSETQQQRLAQYVRDLGGSLLILGGDHAFAAGGYSGTELDALSPLASDPPTPTTHWMLLVDSSGSMAESSNGRSRWTAAVESMLRLLPSLPPKDIVRIGSFARDLKWWVDGQPAAIAAASAAPPPNLGPNGPTNLQPVLIQISKRIKKTPCELLLLTDADTTIDDPQSLAAALKSANVRVSLLALGSVSPDNPVVQIVNATDGHWSASDDSSRWIDSLQKLMRSAAPSNLETTTVQAQFDPSLKLPQQSLDHWNHTWLRSLAAPLASGNIGSQQVALAAWWRMNLGSVAAAAFMPTPAQTQALTSRAQAPRDPRFRVTWECGATIKVSVDASDQSGYLNNLRCVLNLSDHRRFRLQQSEPGIYSVQIPAARLPCLATVELHGQVIDRRAIAGRYAPEFDAIGNDDAALAELAARTGGAVIAPSQHLPIHFAWPAQQIRIDSYFAAAGAIALAAGIIGLRSSFNRRGRAAFSTMKQTSASDE